MLGIATEIHLVQRLAAEHADRTVVSLDPIVCPCSTMFRIDAAHLAWVLENLVEGRVVGPGGAGADAGHHLTTLLSMRAVVVDVPEWELEERRRKGLDLFDEVWDGVLHMVPQPSSEHQGLGTRLVAILLPLAEARGLRGFYETGLFLPGAGAHDYRVPDLVFARPGNVSDLGIEGRAELAIEILSPNDETYDKIDFYAEVGVQELLVIEPRSRRVELFVLRGGRLHAALPHTDGSVTIASLGMSFSTVGGPALRLEWPEGASEI